MECRWNIIPVFLTVSLLCGLIGVVWGQDGQDSTIRKLRKHILTGYDVHARPVHHHENSTMVEIAFFPEHITDLNEKRGILTLEAWAYMGWQDDHLKWNPVDFSGLDHLRLSDKEIWKPDISVMEGRGSKIDPWHSVNVELNSSGYVMWYPSATMDVICGDMDYTGYPEDSQSCTVTLGSWGSDARDINLAMHSSSNLEDYELENPQWKMVSASSKREEKRYSLEDPEPYVFAEFELRLRRQNVPHGVMSCVPDTVARILTLCMFWITNPIRKMIMGCTSLLVLTAVAVGITQNIPSPAAAPYALHRVTSGMAVIMAAIIVEMMVSAMAGLSFPLPSWMDNIWGSTACLLFRPNNEDPENPNKTSDKADMSSELRKVPQWPTIAAVTDRILSVVFLIVLFSV